MKRYIGIFFLLLMGVQLLPIKEMGKLLFNNQIVEEHPVDGCTNDNVKLAKELKFIKQYDAALQFAHSLSLKSSLYSYFEKIPSGPAREIHCPPPNC